MRRSAAPGGDILDEIFAIARRIDPTAWAERDRLTVERGVNPDLICERPRSAAEKRMQDRRLYSLQLAMDASIAGGDPEIAQAMRQLHPVTAH
jgi:hypothetical protein